jgi:acyl-CoA synthetase (AMP-forming)/AMP-acid ligase II
MCFCVFVKYVFFFVFSYGVSSRDIVYCPLPLYHSAGGMIGVGMIFQTGCKKQITIKRFVSNLFLFSRLYGVATQVQRKQLFQRLQKVFGDRDAVHW